MTNVEPATLRMIGETRPAAIVSPNVPDSISYPGCFYINLNLDQNYFKVNNIPEDSKTTLSIAGPRDLDENSLRICRENRIKIWLFRREILSVS